MPPLDSDPPEQREYRRILNPFFSKGAWRNTKPAIREIARQLIEKFVSAGPVSRSSRTSRARSRGHAVRVILISTDDALMDTARERVVRSGRPIPRRPGLSSPSS